MSEFDFVEKQYLGLNKMSLTRRISLELTKVIQEKLK